MNSPSRSTITRPKLSRADRSQAASILSDIPYKETHSWNDLINNETAYPELQSDVENMLINNLGYLPDKDVGIKHYPFLRTLLHSFSLEQLDLITYFTESRSVMKDLRNSDLVPFSNLTYQPDEYEAYFQRPDKLRSFAKQRLTAFLGYSPDLTYSMGAEMYLQNSIARGKVTFTEKSNAIDHRAMTIIKYRHLLLKHGKCAADELEFWYLGYKEMI